MTAWIGSVEGRLVLCVRFYVDRRAAGESLDEKIENMVDSILEVAGCVRSSWLLRAERRGFPVEIWAHKTSQLDPWE